MTGSESRRAARVTNWVARIIGLIVMAVLMTIIIGQTVMSIQEEGFKFDIEGLEIVIPVLAALTVYILSWWHKTIGGSLLVFISIMVGVLASIAAWKNQTDFTLLQAFRGWLILGSPFLVIGVLFLISAYLDRKTA